MMRTQMKVSLIVSLLMLTITACSDPNSSKKDEDSAGNTPPSGSDSSVAFELVATASADSEPGVLNIKAMAASMIDWFGIPDDESKGFAEAKYLKEMFTDN